MPPPSAGSVSQNVEENELSIEDIFPLSLRSGRER